MGGEKIESLFMLLFVAFVGTSLLSMFFNSLVIRRLRGHHPAVWESMGGTSLLSGHKLDVFVRVLKLCYGSRLRSLSDPALVRIAIARNLLEVGSISLFVYLVWLGIQMDTGAPKFM